MSAHCSVRVVLFSRCWEPFACPSTFLPLWRWVCFLLSRPSTLAWVALSPRLYTVQHFFALWIALNHCFLSHWSFFHMGHPLVSKANPSPCVCSSSLWSYHCPLSLMQLLFPVDMPLFPLAFEACKHRGWSSNLILFLPPENLGEFHTRVWSVFS